MKHRYDARGQLRESSTTPTISSLYGGDPLTEYAMTSSRAENNCNDEEKAFYGEITSSMQFEYGKESNNNNNNWFVPDGILSSTPNNGRGALTMNKTRSEEHYHRMNQQYPITIPLHQHHHHS